MPHDRVGGAAVGPGQPHDGVERLGRGRGGLLALAAAGRLLQLADLPVEHAVLLTRRARPNAAATATATAAADALAFVCQRGHRHRPAVVGRPDDVLVRHHRVGEEHLVEGGAAVHLLERAHVDARLVHVDDEVGDALVLW